MTDNRIEVKVEKVKKIWESYDKSYRYYLCKVVGTDYEIEVRISRDDDIKLKDKFIKILGTIGSYTYKGVFHNYIKSEMVMSSSNSIYSNEVNIINGIIASGPTKSHDKFIYVVALRKSDDREYSDYISIRLPSNYYTDTNKTIEVSDLVSFNGELVSTKYKDSQIKILNDIEVKKIVYLSRYNRNV